MINYVIITIPRGITLIVGMYKDARRSFLNKLAQSKSTISIVWLSEIYDEKIFVLAFAKKWYS